MESLRAAAHHAGDEVFGDRATVLLGGVSPTQADTRAVNDRDTKIVVPTVLVLTAIILGLLLRSVVAALYLLVAVTLNYFAALGAASFLFYRIQGDDGIAYAVPLYAFIFLVALGADYTIFLMSRVREEVARSGTLLGTQDALRHTGGVITSAGLILAGTFLVLTTLPLRDLYQLGVVVALGVLLDTFVVRGLLVPGIVILLGRWNWWPGRLPEQMEQAPDGRVPNATTSSRAD
jgi:RND superfamily putative drug exporter